MSERSIALHRQMQGPNPDRLAKSYLLLANAQHLNGNPKIAIEAALKGLKITQTANPLSLKIPSHYDQLATFHLALNDTAGARIFLQEWDAFHRLLGKKATMQARINLANYWSMYHELKGELGQGIRILEDTLNQYGESLRAKGGFLGIVEFRLCELYTLAGDYQKSLFYADRNIAMFENRLKQQRGKLFSCTH